MQRSCLTPFYITDKITKEKIPVPCGKCPKCVARRTSGWSFRLMEEEKVSSSAHFITLTYATANLPFSGNGKPTLQKSDLQKFFKRLRKAHGVSRIQRNNKPIKYYAVGEYGSGGKRPHYHIILFNADITLINDSWNLGHVHYGTVSGASIGYTLKYLSKSHDQRVLRNNDVQSQFSLMSKGLGKAYTEKKKMIKWHKSDLEGRMYVNLQDGKKASMPRYYKDKIYSDEERKRISFFRKILMLLEKEEETNYRDQAEGDKAQFRKMSKRSKEGCSL